MTHSASLLDTCGWVSFGALTILFIVQSRVLREFTRPRISTPESWPSLSVVLVAGIGIDPRQVVSELLTCDYPGELEIVLVADSPEHAATLTTLTITSSRIRIVHAPPETGPRMETIATEAEGDWLVVLSSTIRLEPDAIRRLVADQIVESSDASLLLPRLHVARSRILRDPMVPWLRLTIAPLLPGPIAYDDSCVLIVRKDRLRSRGAAEAVRCLDGYDSASRGSLGGMEYRKTIAHVIGGSGARRAVVAIALTLLFVLPLPIAIVTRSFPWIIATIVSYWLRLRVSPRTGEVIPAAILHPLAVLLLAADLLRAPSDETRNSEYANT